MSDAVDCGSGGGDDSSFGLRIASVFIILVGSMAGALFPVLAKRSKWLHVPKLVFEFVLVFIIMVFYIHLVFTYSFAKYFGSGVIVRSAPFLELELLFDILFFQRSPQRLSIFWHLG